MQRGRPEEAEGQFNVRELLVPLRLSRSRLLSRPRSQQVDHPECGRAVGHGLDSVERHVPGSVLGSILDAQVDLLPLWLAVAHVGNVNLSRRRSGLRLGTSPSASAAPTLATQVASDERGVLERDGGEAPASSAAGAALCAASPIVCGLRACGLGRARWAGGRGECQAVAAELLQPRCGIMQACLCMLNRIIQVLQCGRESLHARSL